MNTVWIYLFTHWKTTVMGLIGAAIAVLMGITTVPAGSKWIAYALAGLSALLGSIQKDAGTTEALMPGSLTPQAVPSHEDPDDPTAKPTKG
jgi:hypothetical protein